MTLFGPDLQAARAGWLYPSERLQGFWRGLGIAVALLLLNFILQNLLGFLLFVYGFHGSFAGAMKQQGDDFAKYLQASVVIIFPAGLATLFVGRWLSKFGLPDKKGILLLQLPKLGWAGWLILLGGFAAFMFLVISVAMQIFNVNPDTKGLVEKTVANMAGVNPWLFAAAIPSLIFGAPLAEEITFRGPLFSALEKSVVGKAGAVIITAALWAGAHGLAAPLPIIGMLFLMGLVLGVLLLRFGSLWVTIGCHFTWNLIMVGGLFAAGANP